MAIDVERRRPVLGGVTGGLSGPAIKPVALAMVWKVAQAVAVPVMGIGGIATASDVLEFMVAGASLPSKLARPVSPIPTPVLKSLRSSTPIATSAALTGSPRWWAACVDGLLIISRLSASKLSRQVERKSRQRRRSQGLPPPRKCRQSQNRVRLIIAASRFLHWGSTSQYSFTPCRAYRSSLSVLVRARAVDGDSGLRQLGRVRLECFRG